MGPWKACASAAMRTKENPIMPTADVVQKPHRGTIIDREYINLGDKINICMHGAKRFHDNFHSVITVVLKINENNA